MCLSTTSFTVSVNGELEDCFTSTRGIPQDCSFSPYLYVIVNNALSKLLNKAASGGQIAYHTRCRKINLTHLSFADDILVFTNGSSSSLRGTLNVFDRFAKMSGLRINVSKSTLFAAGREKQTLETEAVALGLSVSTLHMRYLGHPLTTKTMTRVDYEPLVDKFRKWLMSWTYRHLSYVGRLQLIKSVIMSIF